MSEAVLAERTGEEIWESNIPGRVFVEIVNHNGRPQSISCVGKGSRLRVKTADRQIAEENIRLPQNNPFRNGMLTRVDSNAGALEGDQSNALTDEALFELFALPPADFVLALDQLTELNIRRLKEAAIPQDATASQVEAIQSVLNEKWPIGGDTPTYREMTADPDGGVGAAR